MASFRKFVAIFLIFPIMPLLLMAAATQIDWTQIKNRPSIWNDPGLGTILKRTGAFTFGAAVAGTDYYSPGNLPAAWNDPGSGTLLKRTGAFTFSAATAGVDYQAAGSYQAAGNYLVDPGGNGILKRTALNTTAIAGASDYPVFVASGASHAPGVVPDPGSSAGTTRFLREDATWVVPTAATKGNVTWGCTGVLTAGATLLIQVRGPTGCTDNVENDSFVSQSSTATLGNLYVQLTGAAAVHNIVFTVRVSSVDSAITCTIVASGTTCNDTTHTASVSAGNLVSFKAVTLSGETGSGVIASISRQ